MTDPSTYLYLTDSSSYLSLTDPSSHLSLADPSTYPYLTYPSSYLSLADPSIQLPTPPFPETTFFEDLKEIIENWSLSQRVPPDFFCNSCRQVSRKVETFLNEAILNKEIETISGGLCHIVPSDLQVKVLSDTQCSSIPRDNPAFSR